MFFNNERVEIWSYSPNLTYDEYGEPRNQYNLEEVVDADFQPLSPEDSMREFGEIMKDTYKVYFDPDVSLDESMLFRIGECTYEMKGSPEIYNHRVISHNKVILEKQRKPTGLIG